MALFRHFSNEKPLWQLWHRILRIVWIILAAALLFVAALCLLFNWWPLHPVIGVALLWSNFVLLIYFSLAAYIRGIQEAISPRPGRFFLRFICLIVLYILLLFPTRFISNVMLSASPLPVKILHSPADSRSVVVMAIQDPDGHSDAGGYTVFAVRAGIFYQETDHRETFFNIWNITADWQEDGTARINLPQNNPDFIIVDFH